MEQGINPDCKDSIRKPFLTFTIVLDCKHITKSQTFYKNVRSKLN